MVEGLSGKVLKPSKLDIFASQEDAAPAPHLQPVNIVETIGEPGESESISSITNENANG